MRQRLLIIGLLALAIALIAGLLLAPKLNRPTALSGYVEGEALYLAAPVSGTVAEIEVRRGDRVAAGQRLFSIDPRQVSAQRDQARADVAVAAAQAQDARKGLRPAEMAVYAANVDAARARLQDAEAVLRRVRPLAQKGIFAPARLDDAKSAYDTAFAQLTAARRQQDVAALGARQNQIAAADSRVALAQAGLSAADAKLSDIAPRAPGAARVQDVFFQKGEWAVANQPILALLPDDRIRIRFFAPEQTLSAYAIGRKVRFGCDGCAGGMTATITYVSPRPEFTPPIIYSRQARDRLVYLIEAQPSVRLNPGQPVDVAPSGPSR